MKKWSNEELKREKRPKLFKGRIKVLKRALL